MTNSFNSVGGYSSTIYPYVGEFNIDKYRATIISWMTASVGAATIILPATAMWILSYDWSFEVYDGYFFRPWRLLLLLYTLPGFLGGLWLLTLPESPKYECSFYQDVLSTNKSNSQVLAFTRQR